MKGKSKLREAYDKYSEGSEVTVTKSRTGDGVHIAFRGPAAHFPSLKNQKIKGTNILRSDAKARLMVATNFVMSGMHDFPFKRAKKGQKMFCLILCAYRKNSFDEDNFATTVKDWLEPRIIRKKDRGWGVGLVENDKDVAVFAVKKTKDWTKFDTTNIFLLPIKSVAMELDSLINAVRQNFYIDDL